MPLKVLIKLKHIIILYILYKYGPFFKKFYRLFKGKITVIIYLCFGHFLNICTINQ